MDWLIWIYLVFFIMPKIEKIYAKGQHKKRKTKFKKFIERSTREAL